MATSTPTSTPIPAPAPAPPVVRDRDTELRRERRKKKKQAQIWLPQLVATLIFCLLLPCSHLFPFSSRTWGSLVPSFLDFSTIDLVKTSPFVVNSVMYVSLFATVILILVGTWQFSSETKSTTHSDWYSRWAYRLTRISLFLVGVWAISILTTDQRLWIIYKWGIELWSLLVFIVFALIDGLYWLSFRKEIQDGNQTMSIKLKKTFCAKSFWFIDIPVILGVISVGLLTLYMHGEPGFRELTQAGGELFKDNPLKPEHKEIIFETFLHGFSTGSIVMHMAFSQFIFGLLKTLDLRERFDKGLEDDLYV